jgi:hypothetical protein
MSEAAETLVLRAELILRAGGEYQLKVWDSERNAWDTYPVPAQYAAMLPQLLAQLK